MLKLVVHPGAEKWAPDAASVDLLSESVSQTYEMHLHPRDQVVQVWESDHPGKSYDEVVGDRYKFRAYQDGYTAYIFVDSTETPESALWLVGHELAHMNLRQQHPELWRFYQKVTPEDYFDSDEAHERDPEEQLANAVGEMISGGNYPRAWWRKRVYGLTKEAVSAQEVAAAVKRLNPTVSRGMVRAFGATAIPTKAQVKALGKQPELFAWQEGLLPPEFMQAMASRYNRHSGKIFLGPEAIKGFMPGVEGRGPRSLLTLHEALERKAVPLGKSMHLSPGVLVEESNLLNRVTAPKGQGRSLLEAAGRIRALREAGGETGVLRGQFQEVFKDPRALEFLEKGQRVPAAMKRRFLRGAASLPETTAEDAARVGAAQAEHIAKKEHGHQLAKMLEGPAGKVRGMFKKEAELSLKERTSTLGTAKYVAPAAALLSGGTLAAVGAAEGNRRRYSVRRAGDGWRFAPMKSTPWARRAGKMGAAGAAFGAGVGLGASALSAYVSRRELKNAIDAGFPSTEKGVGDYRKEKEADMTKRIQLEKIALWGAFYDELSKLAIPAAQYMAMQEAAYRRAGIPSQVNNTMRPMQQQVQARTATAPQMVPPSSRIAGASSTQGAITPQGARVWRGAAAGSTVANPAAATGAAKLVVKGQKVVPKALPAASSAIRRVAGGGLRALIKAKAHV